MKNPLVNIISLFLLFFFGCEFTKTDIAQSSFRSLETSVNYTASHPVMGKLEVMTALPVDPAVQTLVDSMKDVSKEDAAKLYTIFSGLALYVEQTEKIDTTAKMVKMVGEIEDDFGYSKGKYTTFTDAVEKFLTDKGYKKTKKIVASVADADKEFARSSVFVDLNIIAQAAKVKRDE